MRCRCRLSGSATDLATRQRGSSEENGPGTPVPIRGAGPRIRDFRPPTMDWLSYSTLPESADSKPSIMRVSVDGVRIRRAADHGQTFAGVDVGGDVEEDLVACGARP